MLLVGLGALVVFLAGVAIYTAGRLAGAATEIEEDVPPGKPSRAPESADPCIALAIDVTNTREEAERAEQRRLANLEKIDTLREDRIKALAAALAAAAVLAATLVFQWYNPYAIAAATAAAAAAIAAVGFLDEKIAQRTNNGDALLRAATNAEKAARDAADAFDEAGCAAPRDG